MKTGHNIWSTLSTWELSDKKTKTIVFLKLQLKTYNERVIYS